MSLRVVIFRKAICTAWDAYDALADGINACGDICLYSDKEWEPCDVAVHPSGPGPKKGKYGLARERLIREKPDRRIILESPLFREGAKTGAADDRYYRLSWNGFMRDDGLYGEPEDAPPDRWDQIQEEQGIEYWPWNLSNTTGPVLLCLQKESDASLRGLNVGDWARETVAEIKKRTSRPILVRPHPLCPTKHKIDGVLWSHRTLKADLHKCSAMVTYSSLSAIESVCHGVHTFTLDPGNHAWECANHSLDQLNEPTMCFVREPWLCKLAYRQWKLSEIRQGLPWRQLRKVFYED